VRAAIAGWAWRTPLGRTIDEAMVRLLAGERAASASAADGGIVTAPIRGEPARSRHARFLRRMGLYGMEVAHEALAMSGVAGGPRTGCFCGVGGLRAHWDDMMSALAGQCDDGERAWERGLRDVHPYWMLRHLSNNVHALASVDLALRGEGATFGGATGGAQAIAAAARALEDGAIDAALIVAYDSLLEPETLVELGARRAIARAAAADSGGADVRSPYDERAAGFVPGEAAAAIVLVRERDAAAPLALVEAVDTGDGARAEPAPATLARAARRLADGAGFVDGAARAWPELDAAERAALAELAGPATPLSAISAAMGQLGAATAVAQAIALAEALRRGALPPIAGLERPAAGPLAPVLHASPTRARVALGVSTGAPGLAAAVRVEVPA
jgi:3-oxoacyl-[acyl-carrier-protein] synthase II